MERTDERRHRQPQGRSRRRPSQYGRRAGASAPPARQQTQRRPGGAPRAAYHEQPVRRRPPQTSRQENPYRQPPRRPAPPRNSAPGRRARAAARARQARRRRQLQSQRRIVTVLLVLVASMLAVFCLYQPENGAKHLPRTQMEAPTDPPATTEPPTEPPTQPPTEPPTEPPTQALPEGPIVVTPIHSLEDLATLTVPEYVSVQIIDADNPSRRCQKLNDIKDIVIHYVGNPGATAQQNRDWYAESNSDVSSHFVVGLQGEIIQCIPLDEKSSATNHRNGDTISIEVCHPDESGKFTEAGYNSVVELTAWLVKACGLTVDNVIRHYEVTGKECPMYYVKHEDAWWQLRADIAARVAQ